MLGNPLFLVKARLQAYSPLHAIGKASSRYNYKGTYDGLRSIVRSDGWGGLVRGIDAAVLRTAMGSTVQLPAYNWSVFPKFEDRNAIMQKKLFKLSELISFYLRLFWKTKPTGSKSTSSICHLQIR